MTWQIHTSEDGVIWERWHSGLDYWRASSEMRFLRQTFPRLYLKAANADRQPDSHLGGTEKA